MSRSRHPGCTVTVNRRGWLRNALWTMGGVGMSPWLSSLANAGRRRSPQSEIKHCIILWMAGGPSQTDTFDMKPDHENGGEFSEIATNVPGIRFSEHLPGLAKHADKLSIVRSLTTREGDHGRGTYLVRTGQIQAGPVRYPTIGSSLSKQLGHLDADLPNYVSIVPQTGINPSAFGPGFLGPKYAAATVGTRRDEAGNAQAGEAQETADSFPELGVDYLELPDGVDAAQAERRFALWQAMQSDFLNQRATPATVAHDTVYRRAMRVMSSEATLAFELTRESDKVRDAYGRSEFGQGCLLARRLIEQGVPLIEVTLGGLDVNGLGWDTHLNNFPAVRQLSTQLDQGWSTLMTELEERGLMESTTILWIGEFGRTPTINQDAGRDHFPNAWSCVLAGGGIQGGSVYGATDAAGESVAENGVEIGDVLATLCRAVGVEPDHENMTTLGRPIRITEGNPIKDILL